MVSDEEWNAIPDVGDARNKKQRNAHIRPDRYMCACSGVIYNNLLYYTVVYNNSQ